MGGGGEEGLGAHKEESHFVLNVLLHYETFK